MEYLLIPILLSVIVLGFICENYLSKISDLLTDGIKLLKEHRDIADEQKNKLEVPPPPQPLGDTELHTQTEILSELQRQNKANFFD